MMKGNARTKADSVLIGPANYAGQAFQWSRALRGQGVPADSLTLKNRPRLSKGFNFPSDHFFPYVRLTSKRGRLRRRDTLLSQYSHFALDGFRSLLGRAKEVLSFDELRSHAQLVRRLILISHGTDTRDPMLHMDRISDSYFRFMDPDHREHLRVIARHNRELALKAKLPLLVSTPDLLLDSPHATWLPVTIDTTEWSFDPLEPYPRPIVLHAPSNHLVKGSDAVDPVLRKLDKQGRIRYLRVSNADNEQMKDFVSRAHIVVDQVRSGSYGVAAVEAMAAQRVVVGFVADDVRSQIPDSIPIIDAPASNFADRIDLLLSEPGSWASIGARGSRFATKWHDGRKAASTLTNALQLLE